MTEVTAHSGLLHDTKLHVDDTGGNARPVVLIHGWPLSGEAWQLQVPAIRDAGFRVVTYDRRGFGRSDKPRDGYDYDTLADDLHKVIEALDLREVSLVGFSMGGGEVARYFTRHGSQRIHSAVFASAVPPYMQKTSDNPEGPLDEATADGMEQGLKADRESFFEQFTTQFFSVGDDLKVSEAQRKEAVALCLQSDQTAALGCMAAFGTTDFRGDLPKVDVPTLVVHGDSDSIVPLEGSGMRTHEAIPGSRLEVIAGAPHGCTVSHPEEWNSVVIDFLRT